MNLIDNEPGRDLGRIAALSDGVFAFALTVLVLDVRVSDVKSVHSEADLAHALALLWPSVIVVLMTFLRLALFWVGQQVVLSNFRAADRNLTWFQLAFLLTNVAFPFSTSLLADFITFRLALLVYWLNIVVAAVLLRESWRYGQRAGLLNEDAFSPVSVLNHGFFMAQGLYAVAFALCAINTYVSIVAIVLVQLYIALSPRTWRRAATAAHGR